MFDYLDQINSEEHLKDLRREADNERLARNAAKTDSNMLSNIRNVLGQNLVKVGQQLLDEKQR